nr:hypothetical protein Cduv_160 [Cedratvirus duvanny]
MYCFFQGPIDLYQRFNFVPYEYSVTKVSYFVNYKGRKINLSSSLYVKSDNMLSYDDILEIEEAIKQRELTIMKEEKSKFAHWSVPSFVDKEHWLSLLFSEEGEILAYYKGRIEERTSGTYSTSSFISIRPDQRGKGLCTEFATFTFSNLGKVVDKIELVNGATNSQAACACYTAAGLALGYEVYLKDIGQTSYRKVNKRQTECGFLLLVVR